MVTTVVNRVLDLANQTFPGLGRNRILNGEMYFDQRNEGASVAFPTAAKRYSVDFLGAFSSSPGVFTIQQLSATPPTGFQYYARYTTTTIDTTNVAGSYYYAFIPVEAPFIRDFNFGTPAAVTITLSFWIRSSLTGTFSAALNNSGTRCYPFTFSIPTANTWTKITNTFVGDTGTPWTTSVGGTGIYVYLDFGCGSTYRGSATGAWQGANFIGVTGAVRAISTLSATVDITGFQLEIGSAATAFEYRPYPVELAMLQRYYEKSYTAGTAPGTNTTVNQNEMAGANSQGTTYIYSQTYFKIPKCTNPTITFYTASGTAGSITVTSTSNVDSAQGAIQISGGTNSFNVAQNSAGVAAQLAKYHWTAEAGL
jgi:hypothetical protein